MYPFVKTKVEKPWGYEIIFAKTDSYAGKVLFIKGGEELSYQYHNEKEETIYLFRGHLAIDFASDMGQGHHFLHEGEVFHIQPKVKHRFKALLDSYVFEVSTPHLDDVVRLEDKYGRIE